MRKLHLNPDELQVESFRTSEAAEPRRGTVRAHGTPVFLPSDGNAGDSTGDCVCACDTTHTQRLPECDPSANTYCVDGGCNDTLQCA